MTLREAIAIPIALVSVLFLLLALSFPFTLVEQAKKDAHRLNELRVVEAGLNHTLSSARPVPTDDELRQWAKARNLALHSSISTTPIGCLNDFRKMPDDKYVVGFWVGEWSECLSSPSGKTTLEPTVLGLLGSGLWKDGLLYVIGAMSAGWAAWKIGLRDRPNGR